MVDNGLTQTYTLRLTFEGPCQVGSGAKISKKEYFHNLRQNTVSFYDRDKLMALIVEKDLLDAYETYMLGPGRTLFDFFSKVGGAEAFASALQYTVGCGDAIQGEGSQPTEILTHIRSPLGQVYLPGSSVKGMLRTAVTVGCVLKKRPATPRPAVPGGNPSERDFKKQLRRNANDAMRQLDTELFHLLGANAKSAANAVNSIFRGVSVADSAPIDDKDLILCRKRDVFPNGTTKEPNVVRECIRPGVTVKIPITFDPTTAKFLTPDFIMESVRLFDEWYTANILSHYRNIPLPTLTSHLFLGGGSGYPSKTVTGPWLGDAALPYITALLASSQFGKNNADDEKRYGISPHMLKYTVVHQAKLPFGLCKVEFQ